jgi:hypothetical protein
LAIIYQSFDHEHNDESNKRVHRTKLDIYVF